MSSMSEPEIDFPWSFEIWASVEIPIPPIPIK